MKNKYFIIYLLLFFLLSFLFVTCTTSGAEVNLMGKWNVDDFVIKELPSGLEVDEVDGYILLKYNGTYDIDFDLTFNNGGTSRMEDDGIITSDYSLKTVSFFSNDSDDDDQIYSYILSGSSLIMKSDDYEFECTRISYNY